MAVTRVTMLPEDEGGRKSPNERSYRVTWQVHSNDPLDTAAQILASLLLPQMWDVYTGWTEFNGVYSPKVTPDDQYSVVVERRAKRSSDSPFVWEVTIVYEGIDSPTAKPAEVKYSQVPYQEQVFQDRFGGFIANSAGDLYDGGVTVDRQRGLLTITRDVPYDSWDPDLAESYRNTLNALPYKHGTLKRAGLDIYSPMRSAKIKSLDADRVVVKPNPNPAAMVYYWRVTCQIEFDYSLFTDREGKTQPKLWRKVVADCGFNEIVGGLKKPIRLNHQPVSTPHLLDGKGKRLAPYGDKPTTAIIGPVPDEGAVIAEPDDYYQAITEKPLVVDHPGVLANDSAGDGDPSLRTVVVQTPPANGTLTLTDGGVGGGFTYTSDDDFRGWDKFTYKVNNGLVGNETTVLILVVGDAVPVNVFEVYPPADWTPITAWVGNW